MTIQQAYQQLLARLYEVYDTREAANIADLVIEKTTGQRKIERILYKDLPVSNEQQASLQKIGDELLAHRPVQYALGHAWFFDMLLQVNESVLIPRPETEELCQWIVGDTGQAPDRQPAVLDIGTGSGCIALAIKKLLPQTTVEGIDISEAALQVAKVNATELNLLIDFVRINILDQDEWRQLGKYDIIVSNPPYIARREAADMRHNVLKYEPDIALFVDNEDPLLFYRAIAQCCQEHLRPGGSLYVEINEQLSNETAAMFQQYFDGPITIRKDMQQKPRMIKAVKRPA